MLHEDRDALLCDFAETYHIFDFRALPPKTLAALAVGLRQDSRIKMKLSGMVYIPPMLLLSSVADNLVLLRHFLSAKKGASAPELYADLITGKRKPETAARAEKERDKKYVHTRNLIVEEARRRAERMVEDV